VQTRDYDAAGYATERQKEADHPGVLLRGELSGLEAPDDSKVLGELLHTAVETSVIEGITSQEALTVWRLVELSRRLPPDKIDLLRI